MSTTGTVALMMAPAQIPAQMAHARGIASPLRSWVLLFGCGDRHSDKHAERAQATGQER
ncbi:MAG: hypothetical protein ACHQC8_03060 [Solirubrobacterales bacterium]